MGTIDFSGAIDFRFNEYFWDIVRRPLIMCHVIRVDILVSLFSRIFM